MAIAEKKLTWDDIKDWPVDVGRKTELVDGRVVVSPSAGSRHGVANANLGFFLLNHIREHQLGRLFVAPIDCILDEHTVYQPDICFVSRDRFEVVEEKISGAPDLAIEILSPSNPKHDSETKFQAYAAFGVREYWIVDPTKLTVRTYEGRNGKFELLGEARVTESIVTHVLAGLEITADDVFDDET